MNLALIKSFDLTEFVDITETGKVSNNPVEIQTVKDRIDDREHWLLFQRTKVPFPAPTAHT